MCRPIQVRATLLIDFGTSLCIAFLLALAAANPSIAAITTETSSHIDVTGQLHRLTKAQDLWEAASTAWDNGEIESAIELVSNAIELAPNDADLFNFRAELYLEIEEYGEAIKDYEAAAKLLPGSAIAHGNLGWTLLLEGAFSDSRIASQKASKLDPLDWVSIFNLGHTYLLSGDTDIARDYYRQALQLVPELSELESSPWSDFQLFVDRNWSVAMVNEMSQWIQDEYPNYSAHRKAISLLYSTENFISSYRYGDALQTSKIARQQLAMLFRPNHMIMAWAAYYEGNSNQLLGDYKQAEKLYRSAISIPMRMLGEDSPYTADFINDLAALYDEMGDYDQAETLYKKSLETVRNAFGPNDYETKRALYNLGQLYTTLGSYIQAEQLLLESLAISEQIFGPISEQVATDLDSLAYLYFSKGDYAKSERLYIRALDVAEEVLGPDDLSLSVTQSNLALLYQELGDYEQAQPLFERSLNQSEKMLGRNHPSTATAIHNVAGLLRDKGEFDEAELLFKEGISISEKTLGRNHPLMSIDYHNLANLYTETKDYEQALQLYKQALSISERVFGVDHPGTILTIMALASLYLEMGESAQAQSLYNLVPPTVRPGRSLEFLAYLQYGWASFHANEGELATAIFYGKQAVNSLQRFRGTLTELDKNLQRIFTEDRSYIYRELADWLIDSSRLPEAQEVLSMLKEDEYFQFIQRDARDDPRKTRTMYNGAESHWAERYEEINGQLVTASLEYQRLRKRRVFGLSSLEEDRFQQLGEDMRVGHIAFMSLQEQMRNDFLAQGLDRASELGRKEVDPDSQSRLKGMLQELGGDTALLTYLVTEDRLRIILTTPSAPPIHREAAISAKELRRQIYEFRELLQNPYSEPLVAAQKLYEVLIAPVAADLLQADTKMLMLQLDDTLRYIPFASLNDGEEYLVQNFALSIYTPAAGPLIQRTPSEHWRVAGLGLTKGVQGFEPLPYVLGELDAIIKETDKADLLGVVDGIIRVDDDFTSDTLSNVLVGHEFGVVHLATHFVFRPGTVNDSYLVLGNGEKLTLNDLRLGNYPFFDLDLIVLSACETALGSRNADGREVEGFGAMAQNRGAASVLATLWPVADISTGHLMILFYALREKAGLTKAEALRQAQLNLLNMAALDNDAANEFFVLDQNETGLQSLEHAEILPHPYFWAPFILMGNWK